MISTLASGASYSICSQLNLQWQIIWGTNSYQYTLTSIPIRSYSGSLATQSQHSNMPSGTKQLLTSVLSMSGSLSEHHRVKWPHEQAACVLNAEDDWLVSEKEVLWVRTSQDSCLACGTALVWARYTECHVGSPSPGGTRCSVVYLLYLWFLLSIPRDLVTLSSLLNSKVTDIFNVGWLLKTDTNRLWIVPQVATCCMRD